MTTATMTEEELVRGLMAAGVPRDVAKREAAAEIKRRGGSIVLEVETDDVGPMSIGYVPPPIKWPVQLVIPWSHLVSDNERNGAVIVKIAGDKMIPKLILQARYREAKTKIRRLARDITAGAEPVNVPLRLESRVWVPDKTRKHDVANFAKLTHDALIDAIYVDDQWLHDVRWTRAGVDVDRPRAEITITPIGGASCTPRPG